MSYDYDSVVAGLIYDRTEPVPYTHIDRNRVEYATEAMAALINELGYYISITTKTDWASIATRTWANWVSKENISRYLGNVQLLRNQFFGYGNIQLPPTIYDIDYAGANAIEYYLSGIPTIKEDIESHYRRCNTFRCGT